MAEFDVVVVGGGHNGLVAGALLAKVKKRVLIVERAGEVGGILRGSEIAPGVHAPGLAHTVGRLRPSVVKDLKLEEHGLELLRPDALLFAPQADGPGITFWRDAERTAGELEPFNDHDADAYVEVDKRVRALASFLAYVNAATPPDVESPSIADAISGLKLGKAFKDLGTKPSREATRALPMAIADFIREAFDDDRVCGALAARAVLYSSIGAWAAGSAAILVFDSAGNDGGIAGQTTFAKGGTQALAKALAAAATSFGAEIRTGAEVEQITTTGGRANGVRLTSGETITARAVAVTADPKHVLTELVDPVLLGPELVWRGGNIRTPGTTAKIDLALSGLPEFRGGKPDRLSGRIVVSTGIDYLERSADAAKYRQIAEEPLLEATIPSIVDDSLAPEGQHVMSVLFQSAPYTLRDGWDDAARDRVGDITVKTLERYAPGFGELVTARKVQTPPDLEREYGLSGGYAYHQEPGLDAFFAWKPILGHARYRFGIPGLYLAGSGAHPGGGITGAPGANAARVISADLKRSK